MKQSKHLSLLEKTYVGILLVVFGGVVLHAPISVGFSVLWPDYSLLIKSWKELLMVAAGLITIYLLWKKRRWSILRKPLLVLIAGYATLHLLLLLVSNQGLIASLAGLAIDLRYLLFFGLVYIALSLYPQYRSLFIKVGIAGAVVVAIFALLQVFVLPHDFLKYLGYGNDTIRPYLTVDQNYDFIRINSTLRGPNPLGAYAGTALVLVAAAVVKRQVKGKRQQYLAAFIALGSLVALWASYSRSAVIGTVVAGLVVLAASKMHKLSTKLWITIGCILVATVSIFFIFINTPFVSNVILHENPNDGNSINSNDGHLQSLADGSQRALRQPLGAGIGSTGSASLMGNNPRIIENQYLFVAHEAGWLGLGLFMAIFILVMDKLWKKRSDWLALGVFASGVSLAVIGLLLPVWVDDTVSVVWWGLASIVLAAPKVNSKVVK